MKKEVIVDGFFTIKPGRMFLMAGPCAIEDEQINFEIASELQRICCDLDIDYIFKASFDKANRTSVDSPRGGGIEDGLEKLAAVKDKFNVPVVTDIHESYQASLVAPVVDIIQIPAFLARQTDLLVAAGETGRVINIKKPQFLSGCDMAKPVNKVLSTGNEKILVTERGTCFGYNNLVVDYRNMVDMASLGFPVVLDATHSTQRPAANGSTSGGDRDLAPVLANAAAAIGVSGYFFEVHPNPPSALCDRETMLYLKNARKVLGDIKQIHDLVMKLARD